MPFTVSHIAAVLPAGRFPLLRDPLILSAFVIGSMSPDVPYFVPFASWTDNYAWSYTSHAPLAGFLVNVPVTLSLVTLYWLVLAAPLRALAPHGVRARLPRNVLRPHLATSLQTATLLVLAAAIGSATHVFWDAFTHEGGFVVTTVPWLQLPDLVGPLPAYRVLQYLSSIFGMAVVCWSVVRWYRSTPASATVSAGLGWRWQLALSAAAITAGALSWWSLRDLALGATDLSDVQALLVGGLTRSVAFMALVVLVGSLAARVPMQRLETAGRS